MYQSMKFLLILLVCCSFEHKISANVAPERSLLWYGDKDGLMSHFLQLKIYSYLSKNYGRTLYVSPIFSAHYGNKPVQICDVFDVQESLGSRLGSVKCSKSITAKSGCLEKLTPALLSSPVLQICYKGPLPNIFGAANRKESVLRAMNLTQVPLRVNQKYTPLIGAIKAAIGATKKYTVVHWRRGDQLQTRCNRNRDMSVNCGTAASLVAAIGKLTTDAVIYVATNEPASSEEYKVLQDAGYKLFTAVKDAVVKLNNNQEPSALDTFVLELSLMIDASTFLGFGLTEIKDVVEHERMLRGKTFCLARGAENAVAKTSETGTWCDIHKGIYKFKSPYVENVWHGQTPSDSIYTAGGIIKNGTDAIHSTMTKKANAMLSGDEWAANAKQAQNDLFPGLPKAPTASVARKPAARPRKSQQKLDDEEALRAKGEAAMSGARVDSRALDYYLSVLKEIGKNAKLPKKQFSDKLRMLVVAGLEGTGHHAMSSMLSVCIKAEQNNSKCQSDSTLDSQLMFTHHGKKRSGLFFSEDSVRAGMLIGAVEKSMKGISSLKENTSPDNNRLYLLGLGYSDGVGMLSYPNFGGANKALNHPDMFLLAAIAEKVGIDFRVLVLQRSANEILKSTLKRGFGGAEESRILVDNAAAMYTQLHMLDRRFFLCLDYNDLTLMKNSTIAKIQAQKDAMAQFLHPNVIPPLMDQMLGKIRPSTSSSSKPLSNVNVSANAALSEFQLESRISLIRALCEQS